MYPDPHDLSRAVIGPEEAELIGKAVLDRCDSLDGLENGILNNPLQCEFDVSSLACGSGETNACLTTQEVAAAKRIYEGPRDQKGQIFRGFPPGGELSPGGWARWLTGGLDLQQDTGDFQEGVLPSDFPQPVTPNAHFAFGNGVMKYLVYHDPDWNYVDYSFENFRSDACAFSKFVRRACSAFRVS